MDSDDALMLRNRVIESELGYKPETWSCYLPQETINKYRWPANLEEYERYPNVDGVDELLRDVATSYNANINTIFLSDNNGFLSAFYRQKRKYNNKIKVTDFLKWTQVFINNFVKLDKYALIETNSMTDEPL